MAELAMLKVSSKSAPNSVAGAIVSRLKQAGYAEIQCVGAGAISQAVKSIAVANGFVAPYGIEVINRPMFVDIEINGEPRTAIKFLVEGRDL